MKIWFQEILIETHENQSWKAWKNRSSATEMCIKNTISSIRGRITCNIIYIISVIQSLERYCLSVNQHNIVAIFTSLILLRFVVSWLFFYQQELLTIKDAHKIHQTLNIHSSLWRICWYIRPSIGILYTNKASSKPSSRGLTDAEFSVCSSWWKSWMESQVEFKFFRNSNPLAHDERRLTRLPRFSSLSKRIRVKYSSLSPSFSSFSSSLSLLPTLENAEWMESMETLAFLFR